MSDHKWKFCRSENYFGKSSDHASVKDVLGGTLGNVPMMSSITIKLKEVEKGD